MGSVIATLRWESEHETKASNGGTGRICAKRRSRQQPGSTTTSGRKENKPFARPLCKTEGLLLPPLPYRKPRDPPVPSPKWGFECPSPTWTHLAPSREQYHVPEHHSIPVIFQLCHHPLAQRWKTSSLSFGKLRKHRLRRQKRNVPGEKPRSWPTNTEETTCQPAGLAGHQSAGFQQHHLAHPLAAGGKD